MSHLIDWYMSRHASISILLQITVAKLMTAIAYFHCRPNSHPFQDRQLTLKEPAKIGRSVARCRPGPNNAVFDCKVLSRNHALLWYENGKFYLQDTKSSNGTFVNNQRLSKASEESPAVEVNSCDIVQFGVDVVDNAKKVTHGCIVSQLRLYLPNGDEAKQSNHAWNNQLMDKVPYNNVYPTVQSQDLYQLHQYLQEALHREQMLEQKLALLQRLVVRSHDASEKGWQALIDEDRLLSRLEFLENQLQTFNKSQNEDSLQSKLQQIQQEKYIYENTSKETLRQALQEKLEAVRKVTNLERSQSNIEDECTHLRLMHEQTQKELTALATTHQCKVKEIQELSEKLQEMERKNSETSSAFESEKDEFQRNLDQLTSEKEALQNSFNTLLEENNKLQQTSETIVAFNDNNAVEDQDVQLKIADLLENILEDSDDLPNLINSSEVNHNFKAKLEQLLKLKELFIEKSMDAKNKNTENNNDDDDVDEIKDLKIKAELDESIKQDGEVRSDLKERGDEMDSLSDDASCDLRQELMEVNKQLLSRESIIQTLQVQIQEMEETIQQLQTAHTQEIESRKEMENEITKFRDDRDRQAVALQEASSELQAALSARENLLEREENVRLEVEASERMIQMCADSSESASENEDAERDGMVPDAFMIFKAKLKEVKAQLRQSCKQLSVVQQENQLLKEKLEDTGSSQATKAVDQLEELDNNLSIVKEENNRLKETLESIESQKMVEADKLQDAVNKMGLLQNENIELKEQLKEAETPKLSESVATETLLKSAESEEKRAQLEQQLKEKDEDLLKALSDLSDVTKTLEKKTEEMIQLQRDLSAAQEIASSVDSLQDELKTVKSNLQETQEGRALLEKELSDKQQCLQVVQVEVNNLQGKLESEQASLAERTSKLEELQNEVETKDHLVATFEQGEEELQQKLELCVGQLTERERLQEGLREELNSCFVQKKAIQRDFNVLANSLKAAEKEKAEITEELIKLQEERAKREETVREQLNTSATLLEKSQQETKKLASAVDSRDGELAEVTSRCQQLIREREANSVDQQRASAMQRYFIVSLAIGLVSLIVYFLLDS